MRRKLITILMSLAMVLSTTAGGTCAAASLLTGQASGCHARHPVEVSLSAASAGSCHIGACPAKARRFFLLPDASSRRIQNEARSFSPSVAMASMTTVNAVGSFPAGNTVLHPPRSFIAPPLFSLYCILIC
jgi:hypothetical protein